MAVVKIIRNNQTGFTLIEIIATLIIGGVLASVAGLGMVQAIDAYLFTRDAGAMAQKAQATYARLSKTLINVSDLDVAASTMGSKMTLTVERDDADVEETLEFTGTLLTLKIGTATYTLLDGLAAGASSFTYLMNDGTAWTTSDDLEDLSRIGVGITMASSSGKTVAFSGSYVPRNLYRPVDVSEFSSGTAASQMASCFISCLTQSPNFGLHPYHFKTAMWALLAVCCALAFVTRRCK